MANKTIAERYIQAWNDHDASAVVGFFAEDAVYIDTTLNRELIGREVIRQHIEWIFDVCPDISFEIIDGKAIGNGRLSIEWILRGSNLEPFMNSAAEANDGVHGLDYIGYSNAGFSFAQIYFDQFNRASLERKKSAAAPAAAEKYGRSGLTSDDAEALKQELVTLMEEDEIYLDSELTLAKLAQQLDSSTNYVSQVINGHFNLHFNDYISRYRVERAKKLLLHKDFELRSMMDIAYEVGFGSNSAFYLAFKKHTQVTPKAFRKQYYSKA